MKNYILPDLTAWPSRKDKTLEAVKGSLVIRGCGEGEVKKWHPEDFSGDISLYIIKVEVYHLWVSQLALMV